MTRQLTHVIYNTDCMAGLRELPDGIVDLTISSPPYDNLRSYNGTSVWNMEYFCGLAPELFRVTKQGGVVVWVVGDATIKGSETGSSFRQALRFKESGFRLHDTMIYRKDGFAYPEVNRYYPAFEYMFVLSKGKPKTANLIADKPNRYAGESIHGTERRSDGNMQPKSAVRKGITRTVKACGVRTNIWTYSVGRGKTTGDHFAFAHPAMFPEKLAEDHILTWSEPGDLVLDPFLGSGTVATMALLNGRHFLGYEINREYCGIAQQRIEVAFETNGGGIAGILCDTNENAP
jgi:site-specific DNA-methyltransferase (adenine-specific)